MQQHTQKYQSLVGAAELDPDARDAKLATARKLIGMLNEEYLLKLARKFINEGLIQTDQLQAVVKQIATRNQARVLLGQITQGPFEAAQTYPMNLPPGIFEPPQVTSLGENMAPFVELDQGIPHQQPEDANTRRTLRNRGKPPTVPVMPVGLVAGTATADVDRSDRSDRSVPTTFMVRNLPPVVNQVKAMQWLDSVGFQDKYDFFLWFPSKNAPKRPHAHGYGFVNFKTITDAQKFEQGYNGYKFPDSHASLVIQPANEQGFSANYARYGRFLDANVQTNCKPFYDQSSINKHFAKQAAEAANQTKHGKKKKTVKPASSIPAGQEANPSPSVAMEQKVDQKANAVSFATAEQNLEQETNQKNYQKSRTTIVIRNLPEDITTQDLGMAWLDRAGYRDQYDFCFVLPKMMNTTRIQSSYMFVNFEKQTDADECVRKLHGATLKQGDVALDVVFSRLQGLLACVDHAKNSFGGMQAHFRPWVKGAPGLTCIDLCLARASTM